MPAGRSWSRRDQGGGQVTLRVQEPQQSPQGRHRLLEGANVESISLAQYEGSDFLRSQAAHPICRVPAESALSQKSRRGVVIVSDRLLSQSAFPSQLVDELLQQQLDWRCGRR